MNAAIQFLIAVNILIDINGSKRQGNGHDCLPELIVFTQSTNRFLEETLLDSVTTYMSVSFRLIFEVNRRQIKIHANRESKTLTTFYTHNC